MNWNRDQSVRLSQACVVIFAVLLLALDIGCYWAVTWFIHLRGMGAPAGLLMMVTRRGRNHLHGQRVVLPALWRSRDCGAVHGADRAHRQKCLSAGHRHEGRP